MGEESKILFSIFGVLDVTGEVVTMWIILGVVTVLCLIVKSNLKEKPGIFQNMVETGVEYLDNFLEGILGKKKSRQYFTFLASLFIFIIFANYSGLIPGEGITDNAKAPTSSLSVTAGFGLVTFVFLQYASDCYSALRFFKGQSKRSVFGFRLYIRVSGRDNRYLRRREQL